MKSIRVQKTAALLSENFKIARYPFAEFTWKTVQQKGLKEPIDQVYKQLGGKADSEEIFPFPYDLEFEDFALFIDEEKSFNRYRAATLSWDGYQTGQAFQVEKYRSFCRNFEPECLKAGRTISSWTSPFAEKHFGKPGEPGDLSLQGSPHWKLEAFQSFLTDIRATLFDTRFLRFSIYDNLLVNSKMLRLGEMVISSRPDYQAALKKNMERRIQQLLVPPASI